MDDRPVMGLIAGGGRLPFLQAQGMREAGYRVACVGLAGQYDADLPGVCDHFSKAGVLQIGRWASALRRAGAKRAVMVGRVEKSHLLYHPLASFRLLPSWRVVKLFFWDLRKDRRSQGMLGAVATELLKVGVELVDTTQYIPDHLATPGVLTARQPSASVRRDIDFAWPILMRMNDLDIGQAVAVKNGDVVAVEAIEGTDAMIARAGELSRGGGWVLAKGAPPSKDPRFDVPTIGTQTIENLKRAGGVALVVAAGKVILLDKPDVIAAADAAGIALVGMDAGETAAGA
ncbi:MAG: LpxI family protein [Phycisphaerales bacterium JB063]